MKQDIKDKKSDNPKTETSDSKLTEKKSSKKISFEEQRTHLPVNNDDKKNKAQDEFRLQVHTHLKFSDTAETEHKETGHKEKKSVQRSNRYRARFIEPDKKAESLTVEYKPETPVYEPQYNEPQAEVSAQVHNEEYGHDNEEKIQQTDGIIEDQKSRSSRNKRAVKRERKRRAELNTSESKRDISGSHLMQTRNRLQFKEEQSQSVKYINVRKRDLRYKPRYQIRFKQEAVKERELSETQDCSQDTLKTFKTGAPDKKHRYSDYRHRAQQIQRNRRTAQEAESSETHDNIIKNEDSERLKYKQNEIPSFDLNKSNIKSETDGSAIDHDMRAQRRFKRAERRVQLSENRLEKVQEKLSMQRRIRLSEQYDSASGKIKHRLRFEEEPVSEYEKPAVLARGVKAASQPVVSAAENKFHQKIHEVENDNLAVEASHKTELQAEKAAKRLYYENKKRRRQKPYRDVRRAERKVSAARADLTYKQFVSDNSESKKREAVKQLQKRKIKQKYAAAAREAAKDVQHSRNVLNAVSQTVRAAAQVVSTRKTTLGIIAAFVLILVLLSSLFTSCTAMLTGVQSAIISTCYMAADKDINESELKYTELETDLQIDIDDTEKNFPGYDEYRYSIDNIEHDPYELMGYLSAAFGSFTYDEIEPELIRLFEMQYTLKREKIVEIRDEKPWYVLKTTLTVRPLSEIIEQELSTEQFEHYKVYMQTYGNRQCFGNPFDFSWLNYVTSPYGYRVHPISGGKKLHRGIDIGVPQGTPIKAVQDGSVVSAGDSGGYGLCVVISGEDGYTSKYAHCSSLAVSAGQTVKCGDVIAYVGSTGNSTGPHLHLEVAHNGEDLNPYYFVDNGGSGSDVTGGGQIPDYAGEPVGDGTFAAMLAEAEKYLGYPYVWGGSSPSTSFDCSGFVSWVINHSGAGNVGRSTAQGLYNICTPVSRENAKPGDLIFFTKTYSTSKTITHVGIYVGNGRMIHCGNPISYANINSSYWTKHFYGFGRLP